MSISFKKTAVLTASIMGLSQGTALAGNSHVPALPSAVPSNPAAGECYARVKIPARHENRSQTVMVQEGYTEYQVEQPHISARAQEVLVKEPSVEYRVHQPRYTTVTEQMMVRPAYEKLQVSPPQFHTVTETIRVSGSRLIWKKGNPGQLRAQGYTIHSTADGGPGGQGYRTTTQYGAAQNDAMLCGQTCEIWCLVEEPGKSVSFNRKALASPSTIHRVPVAAKYTTITKQVLAQPGRVEEIPVPAKYQTIMVEDVHPARATGAVDIAPVFDQVGVNVAVEDERWEWRRVVCETGTYLKPTSSSPTYSGGTYSSGIGHVSTTTHTSGGYGVSDPYYGSGSTYGHTTGTYSDQAVCRDKSHQECYGQDVIDAYNRSAHSSGGANHMYESPRREKHRNRR